MQGFVRGDRDTNHVEFLKALEKAANTAFGSNNQSFRRFGTRVEPLAAFSILFRPFAYSPSDGFRDTDLSVVAADSPQPPNLTIVITDLFQSDNHLETFRSKLMSRWTGSPSRAVGDVAFGLIASKNDFSGTVYDIPPDRRAYELNGKRPVYALLIGATESVGRFIRQAKQELIGQDVQAFLISGQTAIDTTYTARRAPGLVPTTGIIRGRRPASAIQVDVLSGANPDLSLDVRIGSGDSVPPPPHGSWGAISRTWVCGGPESLAGRGFDWILRVRSSSDPKNRQVDKKECRESSPIDNPVRGVRILPPNDIESDEVGFGREVPQRPSSRPRNVEASRGGPKEPRPSHRLEIQLSSAGRSTLQRHHVYVIGIKLTTKRPALPDWVIQEFSGGSGRKFESEKTPNLAGFLTSLQDLVTRANSVSTPEAVVVLRTL